MFIPAPTDAKTTMTPWRGVFAAGDVTPEEIYLLADQYLSPIPRQHPPPQITTVEPPQEGERRLLVETDAQTPLLHMAFHAGAEGDPETLHLELLLAILAEGASSRLHQALVENEGIALSVDGYQDEGFDPGLAWFYMTLPPGGNPAAVERRVMEELERVINDGVSREELAKARNNLLADFWRGMSTINGKTAALGRFEVFHGNYEKLFRLPDTVERVTTEDLRTVAANVLHANNLTVGVLRDPAPGDGK